MLVPWGYIQLLCRLRLRFFRFSEALYYPRLPEALLFTEDQTEVESRRMNEQSFENVLVASQ